jgi:hypothetical protein
MLATRRVMGPREVSDGNDAHRRLLVAGTVTVSGQISQHRVHRVGAYVVHRLRRASDRRGGRVILDQPERGLDQPWICEHLVARLRELKRTRQLIVATANSSIALLCDAEQFVPLEAAQWPGAAHPRGIVAARGSLERAPIREAAEHVFEGGPAAHALREAKYGARA